MNVNIYIHVNIAFYLASGFYIMTERSVITTSDTQLNVYTSILTRAGDKHVNKIEANKNTKQSARLDFSTFCRLAFGSTQHFVLGC